MTSAARSETKLWSIHLATLSEERQQWRQEQIATIDELAQHLIRLHRHREMWMDLTSVLEARQPNCSWTRHYDALYVDNQLLTVTRLFHGKQKNSISLSQVLDEMRSQPTLLVALEGFQATSELSSRLNPQQDKARVGAAVRKLQPWRDQFVAHISRARRPKSFSWDELDDAILQLTEVFKLYAYRLTGANYKVDMPMSTDWHSAFAEPLYD